MDTPTAAVLFLEDSDLDADLIRDRLARSALPLDIDRVSTRRDFEARLASRRYDLILSDFRVPAFEGFDALELAKRYQPEVPFVFVSGTLGEEVAVETLRRGATDYLLKERLGRLVPAVERALAEARERTARRQAQQQAMTDLARREEELRVITDAVPALISYVDAEGIYRFVNRQHELWFGRPREQFIGRHIREFLGEQAYRAIQPSVERALAGERFETETLAPGQDGNSRHLHVSYVPRFEGGRVVGYFSLVTDVTDRRRTEDALRVSELRYRLVSQAANDAIWDWDLLTDQVIWNEGVHRVLGYPVEQVGSDAAWWLGNIHPDDRERVTRSLRALLAGTGEQWQEEYRYRRADGTHADVLVRGQVVRDEAGKAIRMVGSMLDVSDRKRGEQMARLLAGVSAALAELTDSVSTMQKVAGLTVPAFADWCAVDLADDTGELRRVALTHADPDKPRADRELIERYPPRTNGPHSLPDVLRSGQPDLLEEIPDSLLERTAGDDELFRRLKGLGLRSHILVPIRAHGRMFGVLMLLTAESGRRFSAADLEVAQDLAHRSAVAIQNAALYEALREADRRKDEFLATLAHELRNPLSPIRMGLELLRKAEGDGITIDRVRTMMERQTNHMVRLVDDLMDVSRISRGKIALKKERVELATVVHSAIETSRPLMVQAGHTLLVELPEHSIVLDADPTRLAQVFMNLLNNAAKFTDRGGCIRLTAEREGPDVVVRVRDTGIGIPADRLSSIFELFAQVDRTLEKARGGLGIGLTLVRRLVELHGGTVEARSDGPGKGSEFVVRLPVLADRPTDPPTLPGDRPPSTPGLRILIADDNRDGADSLAEMLKQLGHDTRTVYDGEAAVSMAREFRPEVALLDIGMPRLNGFDTCRRIREQPGGTGILLIALTGWGQDGDIRRSQEAGFDHHLVKPADPLTLLNLLTRVRAAPSS